VFQLLYFLIHTINRFLYNLLFFALDANYSGRLGFWSTIRDSVSTSKRLHQIPCTNCQYFTGDYRLKCTVQPSIANSEAAIECSDYQPKTNLLY